MDVQTIVSIAIASLVVFVVAHFAVFWVVKTMYPPSQEPQSEPKPVVTFSSEPPQVFTPPVQDIQHVTVPTYEAPVPAETPDKEGERRGPPPPESTSIRGESRVAPSDAQRT